jgi:Acetyltransferase (GNAT) domain
MEIRDYITGDERKILELFKIVFKKEMSLEYWNWRFIKNPMDRIQIKLMFDGEILAGHYAVSPQQLIVDGRPYEAALSMTTMTHPDYAGKGIFTKLASTLYSDFYLSKTLDIVYGFPNDNSHYAFVNKLGWTDICSITTYSVSGFKAKEVKGTKLITRFVDDHYKTFINSVNNYNVYLNRTTAWFNWRYFDNPANKYVAYEINDENKGSFIVGKLFVGNDGYEIDICELIDREGRVAELISALVNHFSDKKINKINVWTPSNDNRQGQLTKCGFQLSDHKTHFGFRCMNENVRINKNSFYFSMGDSDIY